MKVELGGRTAIVTGSTGGIGFAIARWLAAAGAGVSSADVLGVAADANALSAARLTRLALPAMIAGPTHTGGVEDFVYQLVDTSLP